ncbi:MAG TPA: glycosyltransferase family 2 protein [Alphaproteobacteria bacterium]|nr:glycosyltransferase family 2 protein [Alphaproteobacteria bacterium]
MPPLVSIVMPCRNAAPWLGAAIDSCLDQSWRGLEILVVDNGSTDGSRAIAARYGAPVTVLDCARSGASAARNAGLARARGAFIQFLDADDLLDGDKIRVQMERLAVEPAGTLTSGAWARFTDDAARGHFSPEPVWRDATPEEFLALSWLGGGMMPGFAWLAPRALIDRAGPWNEALSVNDDGEFFCRVALAAERIVFCGDARGYYRSHGTRTTSTRRDRAAHESAFKAIELSCEHLLGAADSARARTACAAQFRRFAYSTYPDALDLVRAAEVRVAALGGSDLAAPGGPAFRALAQAFGWKAAARCRQAWYALGGLARR